MKNGETTSTGTGRGERSVFERSDAEETGRGHDRKYALYWDQTDDPNYKPTGVRQRQNGRGATSDDGGRGGTEEEGAAFPFRRRRFEDLKSMQERKKEAAEADEAFNYGWVDY